MHPHTWPQVLIEAWGRSGLRVENNWLLRCRPSLKRCRTQSCVDLPLYPRSRLCRHLIQRETTRARNQPGSKEYTFRATAREQQGYKDDRSISLPEHNCRPLMSNTTGFSYADDVITVLLPLCCISR